MLSLLLAAAIAATPLADALTAADKAQVAIVAYRDAHGLPTAWPMTPYRDGDTVVVTSTLAFMRKAEALRRDGRMALLAGGWLLQGTAQVHADLSGDEFSRRFLDQELRKYPPANDIVAIPGHRWLFDWYVGRVFITLAPSAVRAAAGSDAATLVTLDPDGMPVITPITPPPLDAVSFVPRAADGAPLALADGPARVLLHAEDAAMRDLRQLHLVGAVHAGVFAVERRRGSLQAKPPRGWWAELQQQWEFHRLGRAGRRRVAGW